MASHFKHALSAITADFEIEPVLADYFEKYPNGSYSGYQVVFKTTDEHAPGQFTYVIIFTLNRGARETNVSFHEFLKSHCACNDLTASLNPSSHVLPQIGDAHTFGMTKKI